MPQPSAIALPQPIEVNSETAGTTTCISVRGEIDIVSVAVVADVVRDALRAGSKRLVLSLKGVEFLDSCCVRLLASTARGAKAAGIEFVLLPPRGNAIRALEIVGTEYALGRRNRPGSDGFKRSGAAGHAHEIYDSLAHVENAVRAIKLRGAHR